MKSFLSGENNLYFGSYGNGFSIFHAAVRFPLKLRLDNVLWSRTGVYDFG
jgi:hypothetical protein